MDRKVYGPYLLLLEPEQMAVLTMHSVINAIVASEDAGGGHFSSPGQARVTRLSLSIGKVCGRWGGWGVDGRVGVDECIAAMLCCGMWGRRAEERRAEERKSPPGLTLGNHADHAHVVWLDEAACQPAHGCLPACPPARGAQSLESQVNLEKLQQEAHKHNMHRADVKELFQQVGRAVRQRYCGTCAGGAAVQGLV